MVGCQQIIRRKYVKGENNNMEKLEIKHLGRRLAYGVKILHCGVQKKMNAGTGSSNHWIGITATIQRQGENCKPIFHPLSDLTKPITHKGEEFVPYDYFYNDPENDWFDGNVWLNYLFEGNTEKADINFIPNYIIEKLLEWNFVIDEPEGTWIDVNTLETNPYQ